MELYDGRDQRESQSAARLTLTRAASEESSEHRIAFFSRNSGTGIEHINAGPVCGSTDCDLHRASGGRELDRVVHEIRNGFKQQRAVRTYVRHCTHSRYTKSNLLVL